MLGEAKVKVADGPIFTLRDDLSRLVKLTLGPSGKLDLDRAHWTNDNGEFSAAQAFTMAHELLQKARISEEVLYEEQVRRIGIDIFVRSSSSGNSGVGELFAQLQEAASKKLNSGSGMSSGNSGSRDSFRRNFQCESLNAQLDRSAKSVTLQLEEQIGPKRVMTVESRGGGSLRVLIESDDEFFLLLQQRNGAIRWISGVDHDTKVDAAENFGVLYRENRSLVETKLIDYLNAYGIMGPVKHTDPQFRATVIERLRAESDEVREAVSNAVERLDADEFAERQDAFKELARHALLYRQVLQEHLTEELPVESRARIERLVSFAKEQSGEYDNLIESLDTLNSSEQLTELLTNATQEESTLLNKRLAAIAKLPLSDE
jgi:hypothetical protein